MRRRADSNKPDAATGDGGQLGFDVRREMFDFVESPWEPSYEGEMTACDGLRISATPLAQTSK